MVYTRFSNLWFQASTGGLGGSWNVCPIDKRVLLCSLYVLLFNICGGSIGLVIRIKSGKLS